MIFTYKKHYYDGQIVMRFNSCVATQVKYMRSMNFTFIEHTQLTKLMFNYIVGG